MNLPLFSFEQNKYNYDYNPPKVFNMKLEMLAETARGMATLQTIINYLNRKLDTTFLAVPGVEHFKNPEGLGFGVRYVKKGSMLCIRFNWKSLAAVGRPFAISSVDIFNGRTKLPTLNFSVDGIPLVKALPALAKVIVSQKAGKEKVLPVSEREVSTALTESIKGIPGFQDVVDELLADLKDGKTYSRKDFTKTFGAEHVGVFDALAKQFKSDLNVTGSSISAKKDTDFMAVRDKMLADTATIDVVRVTGKETYLPNKQEENVSSGENISYEDTLEHMSSLVDALVNGSFNALFITGKGGTGKTQTVEDVLAKAGLKDGQGYFKNTGTASAAGIYLLMYHHRNDIIVFDDSDGALGDQDARNLIKAATDTKASRKLVWNKKAPFIFDPEQTHPAVYKNDLTMAPKYFNFKGKIIFISNLPLDKLDPDGAIRTRAFIINVNPTQEEIFAYMEKILMNIKLEGGATLNKSQRMEVLDVIKKSKRREDASLRTLVRALNLAASGAPNWPLLVKLYA